MNRITEKPSSHRHLEKMSISEITRRINREDKKVPEAIEKVLPSVNVLIDAIVRQLKQGGRLYYLGAGSGGRLSVLDAIEMPTTYGVKKDLFNVILAGGVENLYKALEEEEDNFEQGVEELKKLKVSSKDFVLGISASGTTPFVLDALRYCMGNNIPTGCLVSNPNSPIAQFSNYSVEVITGPEFISGSTRMKCGTAQKLLLDMISTTTMIQLGRVIDNRMVYVSLINNKIVDRAVKMLMEKGEISEYKDAKEKLLKAGNVAAALDALESEKKN